MKTGPKQTVTYKPPVSATPLVAEKKTEYGKVSQHDTLSIIPAKTKLIGSTLAVKEEFVIPKIYEGMKVIHGKFGKGTIQKAFVSEKRLPSALLLVRRP